MRVEIDATGPYGKYILLDGFDVAPATRGFDLSFRVGDLPTLKLDLICQEKVTLHGDVEVVVIPEQTREALVHLGWTPPAE